MMKAPHSRCEGLFNALSLFILRFIVFIILSDVRLGRLSVRLYGRRLRSNAGAFAIVVFFIVENRNQFSVQLFKP